MTRTAEDAPRSPPGIEGFQELRGRYDAQHIRLLWSDPEARARTAAVHQRLLGRSFDPARWDYDRYFEVERARTVPGPVAPGEITADLLDSIIASYPKGTHSGRSSVKSMALSLRDDGLYDITVRTWPY